MMKSVTSKMNTDILSQSSAHAKLRILPPSFKLDAGRTATARLDLSGQPDQDWAKGPGNSLGGRGFVPVDMEHRN
jgi:hypothetical protein